MKLNSIPKSAVISWCPTIEHTDASVLAAGSVAGITDKDLSSTGSLEFFGIDLQKPAEEMVSSLGTIESDEKMMKLAWSRASGQLEYGVLAGAMESGVINFWNPQAVLEGNGNTLIAAGEKHTRSVVALDFNVIQPNCLASAGLRGEIFAWDVNTLQSYSPSAQRSPSEDADYSCLSWNKNIRSILGASTRNGMAVIWDLRVKKNARAISDRSIRSFSHLTWSPLVGSHLVTASDDDQNPVIQIWDVTNTYQPLKTLKGHSAGVLSLTWCTGDPNILLSCGRDNRIICWDLANGTMVGEMDESAGRISDLQWSPTLNTVLASCSLPLMGEGGTIEIHSMPDFKLPRAQNGYAQKLPQPPKWLVRPAALAFGFGGKLLSVPAQANGKPKQIQIHTIVTDQDFISRAEFLQNAVQKRKYKELCDLKSENSEDMHEKALWQFLRVLHEEDASRREILLAQLGFSKEGLSKELAQFLQSMPQESQEKKEPLKTQKSNNELPSFFGGEEGEDSFLFPQSEQETEKPVEDFPKKPEKPFSFSMEDTIETMTMKALVVANVKDAVECCFRAKRYADALVLASFGSKELLIQTQKRYLEAHRENTFISILSLIVKKDYSTLAEYVDLKFWKDVLAICCTYADLSEFTFICEALGERLLEEQNDKQSAILCFICASNIERTLEIWMSEGVATNSQLQGLIEKITVFSQAVNQKVLSSQLISHYARYAELLATQGRSDIALQYVNLVKDKAQKDSSESELFQRLQFALTATSVSPSSAIVNAPSGGKFTNHPIKTPVPGPTPYNPIAHPVANPKLKANPPKPEPFVPAPISSAPAPALPPNPSNRPPRTPVGPAVYTPTTSTFVPPVSSSKPVVTPPVTSSATVRIIPPRYPVHSPSPVPVAEPPKALHTTMPPPKVHAPVHHPSVAPPVVPTPVMPGPVSPPVATHPSPASIAPPPKGTHPPKVRPGVGGPTITPTYTPFSPANQTPLPSKPAEPPTPSGPSTTFYTFGNGTTTKPEAPLTTSAPGPVAGPPKGITPSNTVAPPPKATIAPPPASGGALKGKFAPPAPKENQHSPQLALELLRGLLELTVQHPKASLYQKQSQILNTDFNESLIPQLLSSSVPQGAVEVLVDCFSNIKNKNWVASANAISRLAAFSEQLHPKALLSTKRLLTLITQLYKE